jgi:hypothetical protein
MSEPDDPRQVERDRRLTNIFLLVMFLLIAGGGIWLGMALHEARKVDECIARGGRSCAPIEVPAR